MQSNEREQWAEAPAWYGRRAVAINTELAAYRSLKHDLDIMGQFKTDTRWHRDRVLQRAILIRSLTRSDPLK